MVSAEFIVLGDCHAGICALKVVSAGFSVLGDLGCVCALQVQGCTLLTFRHSAVGAFPQAQHDVRLFAAVCAIACGAVPGAHRDIVIFCLVVVHVVFCGRAVLLLCALR